MIRPTRLYNWSFKRSMFKRIGLLLYTVCLLYTANTLAATQVLLSAEQDSSTVRNFTETLAHALPEFEIRYIPRAQLTARALGVLHQQQRQVIDLFAAQAGYVVDDALLGRAHLFDEATGGEQLAAPEQVEHLIEQRFHLHQYQGVEFVEQMVDDRHAVSRRDDGQGLVLFGQRHILAGKGIEVFDFRKLKLDQLSFFLPITAQVFQFLDPAANLLMP